MLVDELSDDKLGYFVLAGIKTPDTTVIAAYVELIRVSLEYFRSGAGFNRVCRAGVF